MTKLHFSAVAASSALLSLIVAACGPTETNAEATATAPPEGGVPDGPLIADASSGEASVTIEPPCLPGTVEKAPCGKCGERARLCDQGKWLDWSYCAAEKDCAAGESRQLTCGRCGVRAEVCSAQCLWTASGVCTGEHGSCEAGAIEVDPSDCPVNHERTRKCGAACEWGEWSACDYKHDWRPMAKASGVGLGHRNGHSAVWTGTKMLVWGGGEVMGEIPVSGGGAYDPATDTWTLLPAAPVANRIGHAWAWTGTELVVWGGARSSSSSGKLADGAAFNPATDTWRTLAESPLSARKHMAFAWMPATGELFIWGGAPGSLDPSPLDGAAYSPSTDTWRMLPAVPSLPTGADGQSLSALWTGSAVTILGIGIDALSYDPMTDSWDRPAIAGARRRLQAMVDGGGGPAFLWGGTTGPTRDDYVAYGAWFDGASGAWQPVDAAPTLALSPPSRGEVIAWSGANKLWVWGGGYRQTGPAEPAITFGNGASFDLTTKTWAPMPAGGPTTLRCPAVWTGIDAIVWCRSYTPRPSEAGAIFRPLAH